MLPCPEQPPDPSPGGSRWYHIEFTRYSCPRGKEFDSGLYPYWYSNCTVEKLWDPETIEECVGKQTNLANLDKEKLLNTTKICNIRSSLQYILIS